MYCNRKEGKELLKENGFVSFLLSLNLVLFDIKERVFLVWTFKEGFGNLWYRDVKRGRGKNGFIG